MSALGRKHVHQAPRTPTAPPRSVFRGLWFATFPALVLWGVVVAVIWVLWTYLPAGWWVA